jgi:hypothetical protein
MTIITVATQVRGVSEETALTRRPQPRPARTSLVRSLTAPRVAALISAQPFVHAERERDTSLFSY